MEEQQIIQNPSITPGDLNLELSGGYVTAISGHKIGGTGGGGPSVVYTGVVGEITVDNQQGTIGLDDEVKEQLSSIPSKVSDLDDADNYVTKDFADETYQTIEGMSDYVRQQEYNIFKSTTNSRLNGKQDKLNFGYDENEAISSIDGHEIAGTGAGGDYSAGIDLKIENNIISVDTNGNPNNTASNTRNFVEGSWTVASGYNCHAEGAGTSALGYSVHAQGMWTCFSSSKWGDNQHTDTDIYWADGAGATVEGYCNATTSCPMSGDEGQSNYGPIHGGIIKVIGNGHIEHDQQPDPDAHIHTHHPSDALIIFRDGTISAFGDIYNNGKKYITTDDLTAYNVTGQQGVKITTAHDNKITTFGVEITATPVVADTTLSGYNGIAASLDGNASAQWNVGLTQDMLNTINGKLDSSDFNTYTATTAPNTYQQKGDYATETELEAVSGALDVVSGELDNYLEVTAYEADSGKFALKSEIPTKVSDLTDSANYYKTTETSGAAEISAALDNKVDKPDTTQVELNDKYLIYSTLSGAGQPKGWVDMQTKVYSKSEADGTFQKKNDMGSYLTTAQYSTDSATFVTSSNASISAAGEQYALTTTGWAKVQAGSTFTGVTTDVTLTGTGTDASHKLGVAWSALSSNKIDSAKSANSAEYITNGVGYSGFNDISAKFDSLTSYVPYSATVLPIGTNNTATNNSIAIGASNTANDLGFAVGQSNTALKRSIAFGVNNYANDISLAIGYGNSASGNNDNNQSAVNIAIGYANSAADHAAALINVCTAENYAFAAGHANSAIDNSVAFGRNTSAYFYSFDFGHSNDVRYYSYAFGRGLHYEGQWANGSQYGAFVIGGWNATTSYATTADAPLFIIGNGSNNNPSDGFIVYRDGDVTAAGKISANGMFAVSTDATLFGQSRIANVGDTTALGTNWMGVTNDGQGFLKSISGNNVGSLNGTSIQINYKPNNAYGEITVKNSNAGTDGDSKIVHVPTASYNNMTTFDPTNGPNYMLRKTASGFDIGAKVVNVTSMPQNTEANTYYFVYEV